MVLVSEVNTCVKMDEIVQFKIYDLVYFNYTSIKLLLLIKKNIGLEIRRQGGQPWLLYKVCVCPWTVFFTSMCLHSFIFQLKVIDQFISRVSPSGKILIVEWSFGQ